MHELKSCLNLHPTEVCAVEKNISATYGQLCANKLRSTTNERDLVFHCTESIKSAIRGDGSFFSSQIFLIFLHAPALKVDAGKEEGWFQGIEAAILSATDGVAKYLVIFCFFFGCNQSNLASSNPDANTTVLSQEFAR